MAKFCKNCGAQLDDNAPFCPGCGTATSIPPGPAPQQPTPPQQPYAPPPQQPTPPQQQYAPPQQQPTPPQQQYAPPPQQYAPPPQQPVPPQQQYAPAAQGQYAPPPQQGYPQQGAPVPVAPKKGFSKGLMIVIGIAALIVVGVVVAVLVLGGNKNKDFFEIGGDKVPTVAYILGEARTISGLNSSTSRGTAELVVTYSVSKDQGSEMEEYAQALMDDFDFINVNGFDFSGKKGSDIQFAKVSDNDDDYVVVVAIDYDTKGYTLTITRGKGTINVGPSDPTSTDPTTTDPTSDPTSTDPTTSDPTSDPTSQDPSQPGANEVDIIVPGILAGGKTVEAAQANAPSGVTVVSLNSDGSFTFRMTKERQQQLIEYSMSETMDVIMEIYNNVVGVENVKWNPDTFEAVYIIVDEDFFAEANQQKSVDAIVRIGLVAPMVQVYQGLGMNAVTWIGWGNDEMDNIRGEVYSPAFLYEWLEN